MKLNRKKGILLLTAAVLILVCGVGGTLAYLITQTAPVTNTFTPAYVTSQVIEPDWTNGNTEKKNVTLKNAGNVSAYSRAAIVITWKDADGNTMPTVPALGTDYTLSINTEDWTLNYDDGYYYYNDIVAAGGSTANLIYSCTSTGGYTDGRRLCVEVIGSAIQAEGMGATSAQAAFAAAASKGGAQQ